MANKKAFRLKDFPEYTSWCAMKQRCNYPKNKRYARYGGRGIKVCPQWDNSFEQFLSDMGRKPTTKHTLERINNNGNYEPSNCRWATLQEQATNRIDVHKLSYNGITLTTREWASKLGFKYSTLRQRLFIYKWPVEKAFNVSIRSYKVAKKGKHE